MNPSAAPTTVDTKIKKSWSHLYKYRREIYKCYPNFWKIRVKKKPFQVLCETIREMNLAGGPFRVLDIGSSNRVMGDKLKKRFPNIQFESMDIDREQFHDYYDLSEINKTFKLVSSFEVIEHLYFEEAIEMLTKSFEILEPGGRIIISTPNVFHPNRYWEYSHKVSYRYDEIGGILLALGFKIHRIYRIYNDAFHKRLFRLWVAAPLHQYLCVDFAKSILLVAEKPKQG